MLHGAYVDGGVALGGAGASPESPCTRAGHSNRDAIPGFVKMGKLRSPDRENTTEKRAQEEGVLEGFSA
jgi:hypothetical protein